MTSTTKISWTDHTINFWWGCTKVSPACQHCYAAAMGQRFGPKLFGQPVLWGAGKPRFERLQAARKECLKLNAQALKSGTRPRVFVNSMSDWLDDEVPIAWLAYLLETIHLCPHLDFQLLTKRPENWSERLRQTLGPAGRGDVGATENWLSGSPPPNVWIGTTAENQEWADKRIPHLLKIPAKVRFLSCEPLLGELDILKYIGYNPMYERDVPRGGDLQGSETAIAGDRTRWNDLEGSGDARQSMEQHSNSASNEAAQGGTRSGAVFPSSQNDQWKAHSLSGPQVGVAAFQGSDSIRRTNQSQKREEEGQPSRQSGNRDSFRKSDSCSSNGTCEPTRGEEPGGQTHRRSDRSDSSNLCSRRGHVGESSGSIYDVIPGDFPNSPRGAESASVGENRRLHVAAPETNAAEKLQGAISWLITGGESGGSARPSHPEWFRSLRDQCAAAGVPFFFKQWGEWISVDNLKHGTEGSLARSYKGHKHADDILMLRLGTSRAGHLLDGTEHHAFPSSMP